MKKMYMIRIALLFLLTAQVAGCSEEVPFQMEPAQVRYSVVSNERVVLTNELPGRVAAPELSEVRPQVDGIVLERLFEEGSHVVKGQILYQIDPAIYQAAYNTAEAVLEEAEANVAALALLEKRYRGLVHTKAISRQDLDNAISEHGQARARIARAKAGLESAAINLAYTQVKAPISGRIGASSVTPGALVTANQPTPLATIHKTDDIYVDFTQSSADTIRLRRAMAQGRISSNSSAKVRLILEDNFPYTRMTNINDSANPNWVYGDLLFSETSVGQSTGSISMRAIFSNPDRLLLPGMYVRAIIEEGVLDAILIPQSSVLFDNSGGHFVFLLHKNSSEEGLFQVERRNVVLERSLGNRWILKSGLTAGDILVVEGIQKTIPGELAYGTPAQNSATGR